MKGLQPVNHAQSLVHEPNRRAQRLEPEEHDTKALHNAEHKSVHQLVNKQGQRMDSTQQVELRTHSVGFTLSAFALDIQCTALQFVMF